MELVREVFLGISVTFVAVGIIVFGLGILYSCLAVACRDNDLKMYLKVVATGFVVSFVGIIGMVLFDPTLRRLYF